MKPLIAMIGVPFLLLVAAFCVFGFMATFEPGSSLAFRIGYSVIGVGCLFGVGFLIVNAIRK